MEGVEGGVLEGHVERSTFGNAMNKKNETQIMHKRERGRGGRERKGEKWVWSELNKNKQTNKTKKTLGSGEHKW